MKKTSNIMWGLVFIIIGVILSLNVLDIFTFNIFFKGWWTLFIIIPSFIALFKRGHTLSNLFFLLLGVGLLLSCQGIIEFSILRKLFFPTILIFVGIHIIYCSAVTGEIKKEMALINKSDKELYNCFSNSESNYDGEKFEGCNIDTIFGAFTLNLQNAKISSDVYIKETSVFGKTTIFMPENVNVKVTSVNIFGATEDNRPNISNDHKYTIYVNASNVFGGLEIK